MGKYDDITPERLRAELLRFARLLIKMEEEGVLLEKTPSVLRLLGELRQMLFAHEVRYTRNLLPSAEAPEPETPADPSVEDSRRIVEEAMRREKELQDELERRLFRRDSPEED